MMTPIVISDMLPSFPSWPVRTFGAKRMRQRTSGSQSEGVAQRNVDGYWLTSGNEPVRARVFSAFDFLRGFRLWLPQIARGGADRKATEVVVLHWIVRDTVFQANRPLISTRTRRCTPGCCGKPFWRMASPQRARLAPHHSTPLWAVRWSS